MHANDVWRGGDWSVGDDDDMTAEEAEKDETRWPTHDVQTTQTYYPGTLVEKGSGEEDDDNERMGNEKKPEKLMSLAPGNSREMAMPRDERVDEDQHEWMEVQIFDTPAEAIANDTIRYATSTTIYNMRYGPS
jgi:hypothetical protein